MVKSVMDAKIDQNSLRLAASKIVTAVMLTKEYKDKAKDIADDIAKDLHHVTKSYYENAISTIADVAEGGLQPAHVPMGTRTFETPEGKPVKVGFKGHSLSKSWLDEKKRRASGLWKKRKGSSRGVSFGPNHFWLDTGKLGAGLDRQRGRGLVTVIPTLKNRRGGKTEITFRIALKGLPSRYLDLAIRRSLIQGAGGPDRATAIMQFTDSMAPRSYRPTGVGRGFWPEVWRPTMRPIAQRLGRALKKQLIKTINRR